MRVLQLVSNFKPIGGLEIYVVRLSERLVALGHQTTVIAETVDALPQDDYTVVQMPRFEHAYLPEVRATEDRIWAYAKEFRPDVILAHHIHNGRLLRRLNTYAPTAQFIHMYLCAGGKLFRRGDRACTHPLGTRCLVDWYAGPCGTSPLPSEALRLYRQAIHLRQSLDGVSAVIVGSDFMRRYLVGEGVDSDLIHIVDNAINVPPKKPVLRSGLEADAKNILFVGRLVYAKGIQYVIQALSHLDETYRLTIVGEGWYGDALQRLSVRLGLQHRVRFAGFLQGKDLEDAYRGATVAACPSIWPEPVGLVVPEPRGRGLPVVAFNVGAMPEWASRHGYDEIYLAATTTPHALAQAIVNAARGGTGAAPTMSVAPNPIERVLERIASIPADDSLLGTGQRVSA